jgi:hypothetical protein
MMSDTDYDPYYEEEDRAAFELERDTAWDHAVEDAEADRFEYLAGFAALDAPLTLPAAPGAPRVTVNPSYVFVEQPDGGFSCYPRTRLVCQNTLLPFDQKEVA